MANGQFEPIAVSHIHDILIPRLTDVKEMLMMGSRQMVQWKTFEGENTEQKALRALAWMADYYLGRNHGVLDNLAESSGELAMEVLAEHGLVTWLDGGARLASWTDEGRRLLDRFE